MRPDQAYALLDLCDGDEVWSVPMCRRRGVPESWIERLADAFESDPRRPETTLHVDGSGGGVTATNQYHGVRDVDIARAVADSLGVDRSALETLGRSRRGIVRAIREAIEEM